jgi:hypothetical protein
MLRVELRAQGVIDLVPPRPELPQLFIQIADCEGAAVVRARNASGRLEERQVALDDVERTNRTRTLALAAVDLWIELSGPEPEPPVIEAAPPAEPPAIEPPIEAPVEPPRAGALAVAVEENVALAGPIPFTGVRAQLGMTVIGSLSLWGGVSLLYGHSGDQLGVLDAIVLTAALGAELVHTLDDIDLGGALEARAGMIAAFGMPAAPPTMSASAVEPALDVSLVVRVRWHPSPIWFALLDLGPGYVIAGVQGLADGRRAIGWQDWWLGGRVGGGLRF